jgi:hypothetical protein
MSNPNQGADTQNTPAAKPALDGAAVRAQMLASNAPVPAAVTKSIEGHAHRAIYEWLVANGLKDGHEQKNLLDAFEYALMNKGRIRRGTSMGGPEHAAALAGAALWRANNPSSGKGGAGRGQGRKAQDGCTDLVRISVNLRADQRGAFKRAGGSVWLRRELDKHQASLS